MISWDSQDLNQLKRGGNRLEKCRKGNISSWSVISMLIASDFWATYFSFNIELQSKHKIMLLLQLRDQFALYICVNRIDSSTEKWDICKQYHLYFSCEASAIMKSSFISLLPFLTISENMVEKFCFCFAHSHLEFY